MSLLRFPSFASVCGSPKCARRIAAIISLTVVLPLEPVTATKGMSKRPRQCAASRPSARRVSFTTTNGNSRPLVPAPGSSVTIAAAAMVTEEPGAGTRGRELPFVVVNDTRLALGRLAAHWRGRFDIPLVAVTGSNGKTTVKEMIAAILRAHFGEPHTLANEGNLNNDIGLPLTLLKLRRNHRAAVVELGVNHPGETATLAAIASPTVALINNAQREHQEFMK